MLGSCYQSDESHSYKLLNIKSPVWNTNCFQMGIAVGSHSFFKHKELEVGPSRSAGILNYLGQGFRHFNHFNVNYKMEFEYFKV